MSYGIVPICQHIIFVLNPASIRLILAFFTSRQLPLQLSQGVYPEAHLLAAGKAHLVNSCIGTLSQLLKLDVVPDKSVSILGIDVMSPGREGSIDTRAQAFEWFVP
jgi:hypothetical protein